MIHPQTRIGHIHLKVSDLERAVAFYRDVLGFDLIARYGAQAAFLSAGGYHHHIGLNTWQSEGAPPPPRRSTGLYHFAILLPNRRELARTFKRLLEHNVSIEGASDHGVSEAIYFHDPDGNGGPGIGTVTSPWLPSRWTWTGSCARSTPRSRPPGSAGVRYFRR
jgi:catechol 2,3-dioxygenase